MSFIINIFSSKPVQIRFRIQSTFEIMTWRQNKIYQCAFTNRLVGYKIIQQVASFMKGPRTDTSPKYDN